MNQVFSNILVNRGEISNKGLEISLDTELVSSNDFNLTFGGNIGFNKTKITNLAAQPLDEFYIDGIAEERRFYFGAQVSRGNIFKYPANVFVEGEETSLFYGLETDGIYQTGDVLPNVFGTAAVPGDVKIVDQNHSSGIHQVANNSFATELLISTAGNSTHQKESLLVKPAQHLWSRKTIGNDMESWPTLVDFY